MTIRGPFGANKPVTAKNVGTVAAGSTVVEYGDGVKHQTVITVDTTLGAIVGGAGLCLGKLVYTFPAGALDVKSAYMSMALTASETNIPADTPEVGIGNVLGAGVQTTIGAAGATMENIYDGSTAAADCNGTPTVGQQALSLIIATVDAHAVYFNVADDWAASGDAACAIAGTIIIEWAFVV
ncbi:hypothetical protein ES703_46831 [subsurface metagenome]